MRPWRGCVVDPAHALDAVRRRTRHGERDLTDAQARLVEPRSDGGRKVNYGCKFNSERVAEMGLVGYQFLDVNDSEVGLELQQTDREEQMRRHHGIVL